jgi:hypothetical protein
MLILETEVQNGTFIRAPHEALSDAPFRAPQMASFTFGELFGS